MNNFEEATMNLEKKNIIIFQRLDFVLPIFGGV